MVKKTDNQLSSYETKHLIMVFHYQIFRSLCKELPRQSAGWAKLLYMFFTEKKYQLHFFSGEWEASCCKKARGSRTKFNRFYMSRTYSFGVNKDKRILAKGQVKINLNQFQNSPPPMAMESLFQRPNVWENENRCFKNGRVSRAQSVATHPTPLHPYPSLESCGALALQGTQLEPCLFK